MSEKIIPTIVARQQRRMRGAVLLAVITISFVACSRMPEQNTSTSSAPSDAVNTTSGSGAPAGFTQNS